MCSLSESYHFKTRAEPDTTKIKKFKVHETKKSLAKCNRLKTNKTWWNAGLADSYSDSFFFLLLYVAATVLQQDFVCFGAIVEISCISQTIFNICCYKFHDKCCICENTELYLHLTGGAQAQYKIVLFAIFQINLTISISGWKQSTATLACHLFSHDNSFVSFALLLCLVCIFWLL